MIRSEIIEQFRSDYPEINSRVVTDAMLYKWCIIGDKEFCAAVRCIVDNGTTISTTEDDQSYVLTDEVDKFYDINDYPGSGVLYNNKRLEKTTMAKLDGESPTWRDRASGTPKEWYRMGDTLYLDRKIDSNEEDLIIYSVLISDDWDSDVAPFNQLTYLEPFHFAMVLYLAKRAKAKIAKPEDSLKAQADFAAYIVWVKKQLGGTHYAPIFFTPKAGVYYNNYRGGGRR